MTMTSKLNLDELASSIVRCFPTLNLVEQRLSLELYRLLAEGQPVPRVTLAERLLTSVETVNRILDGWPGVFSDAQRPIVGYWGLSIPAAYSSPHTLKSEWPNALRLVRLGHPVPARVNRPCGRDRICRTRRELDCTIDGGS